MSFTFGGLTKLRLAALPRSDIGVVPAAQRELVGPVQAARFVGDGRSDCRVAVMANDRILKIDMEQRFVRGEEPRSHQHAIGTDRQGRRQAAPICNRLVQMERKNALSYLSTLASTTIPTKCTCCWGAAAILVAKRSNSSSTSASRSRSALRACLIVGPEKPRTIPQ